MSMTHEIMSDAAARPEGVLITFENKAAMKRFRFRCYAARNRADKANVKAAVRDGVPPEITGWENLEFLPRSDSENLVCKLWIGVADKKTLGILSIE